MKPVYLQNAQATRHPEWFEENPQGWTMEPKYDGFRCQVVRDETGVHLYSRTLKSQDGKFPELEKELMSLQMGVILDGELIYPLSDGWMELPGNGLAIVACDFQKTKMIAGSKPDEAIRKQQEYGPMVFVAFDILFRAYYDLRMETLAERQVHLGSVMGRLEGRLTYRAPSLTPDISLVQSMIDAGAEGVMFKSLDAVYVSGKRPPKNWYKYKMTDTVDVVVTGYTKAHKWHTKPQDGCPRCGGDVETSSVWNKYRFGMNRDGGANIQSESTTCPVCGGRITQFWLDGLIGAVKFGQYKDGVLVPRGRCSGMTMEQREMFTENQEEFIGSVMSVQHMGLTEDSLRHPQFVQLRDDKRPEECEGTWK